LLSAFSVAVADGLTLPSPAAERCARREGARPNVRAACILLWAGDTGDSASLEEVLASEGPTSRPLALAAVRRARPIQRMDRAQIRALFTQLKDDPEWIRARALALWAASHPERGYDLNKELAAALAPTAHPSPVGLRELYAAAKTLGPAYEQAQVDDYCHPNGEGVARLRCWRFLSSVVAIQEGNTSLLTRFRPRLRDEDWALFRLGFPVRARAAESLFF
jgi:hypothetical protein